MHRGFARDVERGDPQRIPVHIRHMRRDQVVRRQLRHHQRRVLTHVNIRRRHHQRVVHRGDIHRHRVRRKIERAPAVLHREGEARIRRAVAVGVAYDVQPVSGDIRRIDHLARRHQMRIADCLIDQTARSRQCIDAHRSKRIARIRVRKTEIGYRQFLPPILQQADRRVRTFRRLIAGGLDSHPDKLGIEQTVAVGGPNKDAIGAGRLRALQLEAVAGNTEKARIVGAADDRIAQAGAVFVIRRGQRRDRGRAFGDRDRAYVVGPAVADGECGQISDAVVELKPLNAGQKIDGIERGRVLQHKLIWIEIDIDGIGPDDIARTGEVAVIDGHIGVEACALA